MSAMLEGHSMPKAKKERIFSMVTLTDKDLPAIEDWEVGDTYDVSLKLELVSMSKGDYMGSGNDYEARFKVLSAETEDEEEETDEED